MGWWRGTGTVAGKGAREGAASGDACVPCRREDGPKASSAPLDKPWAQESRAGPVGVLSPLPSCREARVWFVT